MIFFESHHIPSFPPASVSTLEAKFPVFLSLYPYLQTLAETNGNELDDTPEVMSVEAVIPQRKPLMTTTCAGGIWSA
ncbi:hypothetical protein RRG08_046747 [Elysia crispata]|uniref:Uncharacterized protein n=1 Tax=Elysia crispata TaxID=231223 RepID=A0AAE0ZVC3_9GAST|nr:hypothetical protein RRG08_046747 [Elysia crispata]